MIVRVIGVDANSPESKVWRIEVVEDVFGMESAVLSTEAPRVPDPVVLPAPPALAVALEIPYWDIARFFSRAELNILEETDTFLGALVAAGNEKQFNWQLATGASELDLETLNTGDYAPLLTITEALPATEADAIQCSVTLVSHPERLSVGDLAYLVDADEELKEAVAILAIDLENTTVDFARGVLDTTPHPHAAGTRLIGSSDWLTSEGFERALGESVFVAAIPATMQAKGAAMLAGNGQPITLTGRQSRPYPPGRVRINHAIEPELVTGDLLIEWAHRDRLQQTAYLVRQDEGDIGPEVGVTISVNIFDREGALIHSTTDLVVTNHLWNLNTAAVEAGAKGDQVTIELISIRDGLTSWQPQRRIIERVGYGFYYGRHWGGI